MTSYSDPVTPSRGHESRRAITGPKVRPVGFVPELAITARRSALNRDFVPSLDGIAVSTRGRLFNDAASARLRHRASFALSGRGFGEHIAAPIECMLALRLSRSAEFVLPTRVTVITTRRVHVPPKRLVTVAPCPVLSTEFRSRFAATSFGLQCFCHICHGPRPRVRSSSSSILSLNVSMFRQNPACGTASS
jgi:hypothetical protein